MSPEIERPTIRHRREETSTNPRHQDPDTIRASVEAEEVPRPRPPHPPASTVIPPRGRGTLETPAAA